MSAPTTRESVDRFRTIFIERVKQVCVEYMDPDVLRSVDVSEFADFTANRLGMWIVAEMAAGKQSESEDDGENVPILWWDAFKLRFFPAWWLRRWPAQERWIATRVRRFHVCPHVPPRGEANLYDHYTWLGAPQPCCAPADESSSA